MRVQGLGFRVSGSLAGVSENRGAFGHPMGPRTGIVRAM